MMRTPLKKPSMSIIERNTQTWGSLNITFSPVIKKMVKKGWRQQYRKGGCNFEKKGYIVLSAFISLYLFNYELRFVATSVPVTQ